MKVVYLVGQLGSNLSLEGLANRPQRTIWCDLQAILAGQLAWLDLAPDGVSPGPLAGGRVIIPTGILGAAYGPLCLYMDAQGYDVWANGYDWRLSILENARRLWPDIQEWAAGQPIYFVCHSMGGLVARAIYALMVAAGLDAQCARIVTLCTPHFGSLEPVRMWLRLPQLYQSLVRTAGWAQWVAGTPGPVYLDQMIASHPSWYELMAWAGEGPLWAESPAQAAQIYTPAFYAGANQFISPSLLLDAQVFQTTLSMAIPPGRLVCVCGVGVATPYLWTAGADPEEATSWLFTGQGDGLVTLAQASIPGAPLYTVPLSHGLIPLDPAVWANLPMQLAGTMGAGVQGMRRVDSAVG